MPLEFRRVEINGLKIRTAQCNAESAAQGTLLLFNGVGAAIEVLTPLLEALSDHHVITLDLPGVGASSTPLLPMRLSKYASIAAEVLDELGIQQVHVLGISWGGALAQQFALQFPQRTERLILAATSPGQIMVPPNPLVMWYMATPMRYFSGRYFERVVGTIYGGDFRKPDNDLARTHAKRMRPSSLRGYFQQVAALWCWTSLHRLHRLKMPTLLMAGNDDPIIPLVNIRLMARLIPNSKLEVFDCGHLFLLTRLPRSVRVIQRFLE